MTTIILAEITAYDTDLAAERVVRVGSQPYDHPSAPGFYRDAFAASPGANLLRREIFRDGNTFGAGVNDHGDIRLTNLDGWLDWMADAYCDGRAVRLLIGDDGDAYDDFTEVFTGVAAGVEVDVAEVRVRIHDRFSEALDQPLSEDTFAGTGGVEGPAALKGQPVPVVEGAAFNVPLELGDGTTANLVYVLCDRGPVTFTSVRVKGDDITAGTQRADAAALMANTPTPGTYDWTPGTSTTRPAVRFGSAVDGQVTADVTTAATKPSAVFAALAARQSVTVAAGDLTALDAATTAPVGGWWRGSDRTRQALDEVAATVGAGYWQDRDGVWRLRRIEAPGTPVATFAVFSLARDAAVGEADIISLSPIPTSRDAGGIQPWKMTLRFGRNYAPQSEDGLVAPPTITADQRARYATEWQETVAEDAGIRTDHPLSAPLEADTLFRDRADAEAEAARRQALYADRRRLSVRVSLTPAVAAVLDLGVTVRVEHPRLGLSAGRDMLVTGMTLDLLAQTADLTLWG